MTTQMIQAMLAGGAVALIAFFAIRGLVRLAKAWRDLKEKVKWLDYAEKRCDERSWQMEGRVAALEKAANKR